MCYFMHLQSCGTCSGGWWNSVPRHLFLKACHWFYLRFFAGNSDLQLLETVLPRVEFVGCKTEAIN